MKPQRSTDLAGAVASAALAAARRGGGGVVDREVLVGTGFPGGALGDVMYEVRRGGRASFVPRIEGGRGWGQTMSHKMRVSRGDGDSALWLTSGRGLACDRARCSCFLCMYVCVCVSI